MVKRRAEAAWEGEDKPFIGYTANGQHNQLRQRGKIASAVLAPLPNQMLDSLKGYLDNIAAAPTQMIAKGGPHAELAASLAISVDTVATHQKYIKRMYKQINVMKNIGTPTSSIRTSAGGSITGNMCPHCAAIGHSTAHKNNACIFDPKKMTDIREWACKLMDKKGVACKDNKWQQGTAKTLVHRNPIKEHLSYEASLRYIRTPSYIATLPTKMTAPVQRVLLQIDTGIVDSGATHLYISP